MLASFLCWLNDPNLVDCMNLELCIAPNHPALPGHFPGNPIVPAVVIVQEVARRLSDLTGVRVDEVRQLRLQQPMLPGQPVTMSCEARGSDAWRVTLKAEDVLIAGGIFGQRAGSLPAPVPDRTGRKARRDASGAYHLLPHSGDMALIAEFETDESGRAYTRFSQVAGHPLETEGHLAPWVALEYAAQLYGCQSLPDPEALSRAPMSRAFIVMVRSLYIDADRELGRGQEAELVLQITSEQGAAAQCEFEARLGGGVWCRGEFTVVSGT